MKQLIILLAVLIGGTGLRAQTPNFKEWFKQKKTQRKYLLQQIEALQVQLEYVKAGYRIVNKGLTAVGEIKNGTYNLDKDYFKSLKQVNPLIQKSPKVNEILVYQQVIINDFKSLINHCKKETNYTPGEVEYVNAVYKGMLSNGKREIDELTVITTAEAAEMKDDERLSRLDSIHLEMQEKYVFTKSFSGSVKMLAIQRGKEEQEAQSMRRLYGIKNQ